eukprot:403372988
MGNCNTCYCDPQSEFSSNANIDNAPINATLIDKKQKPLQYSQQQNQSPKHLDYQSKQSFTNFPPQSSSYHNQGNLQKGNHSYSMNTGLGDSLDNSQGLVQILSSINQQQNANDYSNSGNQYNQQQIMVDVYMVIKLQALIRGYLRRKIYKGFMAQQAYTKQEQKYFTESEAQETIKFKPFQPSLKRLKRSPYTYQCSQAVYDGEWCGNLRDGFGTMSWADGAQYIGNWSFNRACGKGQFIHAEGDVYDGEWHMDRAFGYGVYQHLNGALYQGQWKEDQQHGHGYEKWVDGSSYLGGYKNGLKESVGIYKWNDGSDYEGEWQQNKINGIGTYKWLDGRKFEGQWRNNNMHGLGSYFWSDGRRYEGEYHEDKKHGFGIYHWQDGRIYIGYWAHGKQHGLGSFKSPDQFDGLKYGLWEDGKRIRWFDSEEEVLAIARGELDYTEMFQNEQSSELLIAIHGNLGDSSLDPKEQAIQNGFNPPNYFEETFKLVKIRLQEIRQHVKTMKDKTSQ